MLLNAPEQLSTFTIAGRVFGIDVKRVQEVVRTMPLTSIPLAPVYVRGLINLRGQIATAIGLRELFGIDPAPADAELMNVVCNHEGTLISFQVDDIGDVIDLEQALLSPVPDTMTEKIRKFTTGIYKTQKHLLSVINLDEVFKHLE